LGTPATGVEGGAETTPAEGVGTPLAGIEGGAETTPAEGVAAPAAGIGSGGEVPPGAGAFALELATWIPGGRGPDEFTPLSPPGRYEVSPALDCSIRNRFPKGVLPNAPLGIVVVVVGIGVPGLSVGLETTVGVVRRVTCGFCAGAGDGEFALTGGAETTVGVVGCGTALLGLGGIFTGGGAQAGTAKLSTSNVAPNMTVTRRRPIDAASTTNDRVSFIADPFPKQSSCRHL
jgi:hypothetical protein